MGAEAFLRRDRGVLRPRRRDLDPRSVGDLRVWYDARAIRGLAESDPVGTWADQSGYGTDLSASGSQRPLYKQSGGYPVVRFDGSDDLLDAATAVTVGHVFVVLNITAAAFPAGDSGYQGVFNGQSGSDTVLLTGEQATTRFNTPGITTTYHLDGVLRDPGDMQAPMQRWGVCSISAAAGWVITPRMGLDRNNAGRYLTGDVAELLGYGQVLGDGDRRAVTAYLARRWGIST